MKYSDQPYVQYLLGYGLEVPDVEEARRFYGAFGLGGMQTAEVCADSSAGMGMSMLVMGSAGGGAAEVLILQGGAQKRLHHLSFAVLQDHMPRFFDHLCTLGLSPVTPPFGQIRAGLWFQDPWGTWINLTPVETVRQASAYSESTQETRTSPRLNRHLWRELNRDIHPNRLGHLLMFTPDWEKAQAFFMQALGLMTADRAAGKVAFMTAGRGVRDHHCFGLINSTHRGFQHSSFQVNSIDDIGFGALQMHKAGYTEGFGVGRHALASNLFFYIRDPWGSWVEYYADMDRIDDDWQAQDWQDLPYIWPQWAPEFWANEMNGNHEPR